jgi:hypothetical protein
VQHDVSGIQTTGAIDCKKQAELAADVPNRRHGESALSDALITTPFPFRAMSKTAEVCSLPTAAPAAAAAPAKDDKPRICCRCAAVVCDRSFNLARSSPPSLHLAPPL